MIARGHSLFGKRLRLPLALLFVTIGSWIFTATQVDAEEELYRAAQSIALARHNIYGSSQDVSSTKRTAVRLREALQQELEKRDEIVAARQELAVAKQEFDAARADVIERLRQRPEYQSAVESRDTAKQLLTGVLALTVAEERPSIVSRYEQAGKIMLKLERDALAADARATQANTVYQQAQKRLRLVIQQRDQEIAAHPQMRQAENAYQKAMASLRDHKDRLRSSIKNYAKLESKLRSRENNKDKK